MYKSKNVQGIITRIPATREGEGEVMGGKWGGEGSDVGWGWAQAYSAQPMILPSISDSIFVIYIFFFTYFTTLNLLNHFNTVNTSNLCLMAVHRLAHQCMCLARPMYVCVSCSRFESIDNTVVISHRSLTHWSILSDWPIFHLFSKSIADDVIVERWRHQAVWVDICVPKWYASNEQPYDNSSSETTRYRLRYS